MAPSEPVVHIYSRLIVRFTVDLCSYAMLCYVVSCYVFSACAIASLFLILGRQLQSSYGRTVLQNQVRSFPNYGGMPLPLVLPFWLCVILFAPLSPRWRVGRSGPSPAVWGLQYRGNSSHSRQWLCDHALRARSRQNHLRSHLQPALLLWQRTEGGPWE